MKLQHLKVIEDLGKSPHKQSIVHMLLCECPKCEQPFRVSFNAALTQKTCGSCRTYGSKGPRTHGLSTTRLYRIWSNMNYRCYSSKDRKFKYYGGKGVRVCREWRRDFMAFYTWAMTSGYEATLTLDRKNSDGNYEPGNCRWATTGEQNSNQVFRNSPEEFLKRFTTRRERELIKTTKTTGGAT